MPAWIHNRAEHLLAKNPKMNKSQAFAIATKQSKAKTAMVDNLNENIGKPKIRKKSAVSPNPDFRVKISSAVSDAFLRAFNRYMEKNAFTRSQYAGGGGGGSPKYTSVIPPFSSPPVKTAGPPSEDKSKTAGLTDTASEARAKVDAGKKPGLLRAALLGEFATPDQKFSKGTQKALVSARRDPRLYSNLRGMATLESKDKRKSVHGKLDRKTDHTILSAAKEGLTRGALRKESMVSMRDELEKLNNVQDPQAQLSKHQGIGIPKTTAPPGPSIQQVAKPVGFGKPIAGSTKSGGV
jgi:hypothetical protein